MYCLWQKIYHIASIHEGKKISNSNFRIKCTICDKSFASGQRLKSHIAAIHEGKKSGRIERVKCESCNKDFASKQRLKSHITSFHSEKIESHSNLRVECEFCDSSFASKQRLNSHFISYHQKENTDVKLETRLYKKI